jgi:hypothetical protein
MPRLYYLNDKAIFDVFAGVCLTIDVQISLLCYRVAVLVQCWTWTTTGK